MTLRNVKHGERLPIGELCRLAGCTPRTVRHYEAEGLLAPAGETGGGRKLYPPEAAEVIRMVAVLGGAGYSIRQVRGMLELSGSKRTRGRWLTLRLRKLLAEVLPEVERRRAALEDACLRISALLEETAKCEECAGEDCAGCGRLKKLRTLGMLKGDEDESRPQSRRGSHA